MLRRAAVVGLFLAWSPGLSAQSAAQNLSKIQKLTDKCNKGEQKACTEVTAYAVKKHQPFIVELLKGLTNQRALAHIAANAFWESVQESALEKVTEQALVTYIVRMTYGRTQYLAVQKLTDQAVLAEVAKGNTPRKA